MVRSIFCSTQFNALMFQGYTRNQQANKAIDLFRQIEKPDEVNLILLSHACAETGTADALNLVRKVVKEMPSSFHSNSHLLASLCNALIKCGDSINAELIFSKMDKSLPAYGNLINGYLQEDKPQKVLDLFRQMRNDGVEGNHIIATCVFKALSQIGDSSLCQSFVEQIPKGFYVDTQIHNALIDMWVRQKNVFFFSNCFVLKIFVGKMWMCPSSERNLRQSSTEKRNHLCNNGFVFL